MGDDYNKMFPINRHHQQVATPNSLLRCSRKFPCFQSIGITNKWRQLGKILEALEQQIEFPINRHHQQVATNDNASGRGYRECFRFPINRHHQQVATLTTSQPSSQTEWISFQSIGITNKWRPFSLATISNVTDNMFPINRHHQQVAT